MKIFISHICVLLECIIIKILLGYCKLIMKKSKNIIKQYLFQPKYLLKPHQNKIKIFRIHFAINPTLSFERKNAISNIKD